MSRAGPLGLRDLRHELPLGRCLRDETPRDRLALDAQRDQSRVVRFQGRLLILDLGESRSISGDIVGRRPEVVLDVRHITLLWAGPAIPSDHLDTRTRWSTPR